MNWEKLDWDVLDRLRALFLKGKPPGGSYWTSPEDLAVYDLTYAQRIAWKWDAVLDELTAAGWAPPPGLPLLEWGCGSGVAARQVLRRFDPARGGTVRVADHSALATAFTARRLRDVWPGLEPVVADEAWLAGDEPVGVLVLSHVLNELGSRDEALLGRLVARADVVLWVEPGTSAVSRRLIEWRERWRSRFTVLAPCPHQRHCGLLAPDQAANWCHHFAPVPPGILTDTDWVRFAQRAGIDLRSLPYSFLALERTGLRAEIPGLGPPGEGRVLGHARVYKGFARLDLCAAEGVSTVELQKRNAPAMFKHLKHGGVPPRQRWQRDGDRVRPLTDSGDASGE